ncbi:hypothetical protein U1Q18_002974 [Sarracenia purpurea var. burkii]
MLQANEKISKHGSRGIGEEKKRNLATADPDAAGESERVRERVSLRERGKGERREDLHHRKSPPTATATARPLRG